MNRLIIILSFISLISKSQIAFYKDSLLINNDSLVYIENYKEIGITTVTDDSVIFRHQLGGGVYFDTDLNLTYSFVIRGHVGNSTEIFWGDGDSDVITYTRTDQNISHTYGGVDGLKNVFFRNQNFTYLTINGQNLKGNLLNEFLSGYYLYLRNIPLLTGDASNFNPSYQLFLYNIPLITINSAMIFQYSCKLITVQNCSLLTSEVDRIIQRAYDNGNTGGTLEIRGNTAPSATGLSQIATMRTSRGWTINHD